MKTIFSLVLFVFCFGNIIAQTTTAKDKYWILLTDKGEAENLSPEKILAPRALERRKRMGIPIQMSDYPINNAYKSKLKEIGVEIHHASKWLNAISASLTADEVAQLEQLYFVKEVRAIPRVYCDMDAPKTMAKQVYSPGLSQPQLSLIGLDKLHQNGLNGAGILIAVMDNGFQGVNINKTLSHLVEGNRIVATYDFVNGEEDVFDQGAHGAWVLSILAGFYEESNTDTNNFYGSAPGASFILCHTEDDANETSQEEDNWVAAMEFADSIGADIFSTSLGYREMNPNSSVSYTYEDMDGNTTIITRAADMAAAKGILVINSAGNAGSDKITAPADGDSVLAVGAVSAQKILAPFSSLGPNAAGRLKPDICAFGQGNYFVSTVGDFLIGSGTSFSCPMISGFAACLLQANPSLSNMELYDIILQSGDRHDNPDTLYGHGIPGVAIAYRLATGKELSAPQDIEFSEGQIKVFPSPVQDRLNIVLLNGAAARNMQLVLYDMQGKKVFSKTTFIQPFYNYILIPLSDTNLSESLYLLQMTDESGENTLYTQKLFFSK